MSNVVIKYFKSPTFSESDWTARNPLLESGEVGYVLVGGVVTRSKVGPGYWNSLNYVDQDTYEYSDAITNPIGDVKTSTNILGLKIEDILKKMLSPYVVPSVINLSNNLGGVYNNAVVKEIGQSFNTSIQLAYGITTVANLLGATPINVNGGGIFTNSSFANASPITISLISSPFAPLIITTTSIAVTLTHLNGTTSPVYTTITFLPKMMWGTSILSSMTDVNFMAITGRVSVVTSTYNGDLTFSGGGYLWLAIPSMFSAAPVFTDVTNPSIPLAVSMDNKGTLSINNGVGTYSYDMYRSTFSLISGITLRVR